MKANLAVPVALMMAFACSCQSAEEGPEREATTAAGTVGRARLQLSAAKELGVDLAGSRPVVVDGSDAIDLLARACPGEPGFQLFESSRLNVALRDSLADGRATPVLLSTPEEDFLFVDYSAVEDLTKPLGTTDGVFLAQGGECARAEFVYYGYQENLLTCVCGSGNYNGCFSCTWARFEAKPGDEQPLPRTPGVPLPNWPY